jgi:hypothetical protein
MENKAKRKKMKASDSAPMPTKQMDDGSVKNQTTNNPKNRLPLTTIVVVLILFLIVAITMLVVGDH